MHCTIHPAASRGHMLANVLAMNKIFSTSFVVNVSKGIFEN
jgi:hypothetical protein